jgi:DNA-binding CsgD family transcriptional regulator
MNRKKRQPQSEKLDNIVAAMKNRPEAASPSSDSVSPREKDVLIGLSQGHPTKIIARNLDLSYETVRHHLKNLYAKLDVHSREQAVDEARRRHIIDLE